ncbi:MAG TPA: hypothetical protein VF590_24770 [Isosphaeraceae bacterium]|jgi:hypothetical protein
MNIRVSNAAEWREFCWRHGYRRNIDWAGTAQPLATVSKADLVARCGPGHPVEYEVELRPRRDGLIAWGLDVR